VIKQKGGKFTLSDDCHGPQDVGLFYERLPAYLEETGIKHMHYLAFDNEKVVVKEHRDILDDVFWTRIQNW
jgi:histidinol-phosphatase (PHP family)